MELLLISMFLTYLFLPIYSSFLVTIGSIEYNFNKELIPISYGPFFFIIEAMIMLFYPDKTIENLWVYLLVIVIIGTYDDLYGDKRIKGLKGHFNAFFNQKITSGFLKAVIGGFLSLVLGFIIGDSFLEACVHFLLIMLMINMINLFDLRPGRALKVFFVLFALLALISPFLYQSNLGFILLGLTLVVFFQDVHAKIMLGDSGANLIGLHLGIWYSYFLDIQLQILIVMLLSYLYYYTEKNSLTMLIENKRWLRVLDMLGRKRVS